MIQSATFRGLDDSVQTIRLGQEIRCPYGDVIRVIAIGADCARFYRFWNSATNLCEVVRKGAFGGLAEVGQVALFAGDEFVRVVGDVPVEFVGSR